MMDKQAPSNKRLLGTIAIISIGLLVIVWFMGMSAWTDNDQEPVRERPAVPATTFPPQT